MPDQYSRTRRLFGPQAMERLWHSRVLVFGIGGVGGYAVEALARSGIGALELVDSDRVSLSNLNRQIIATHESIGRLKVEVARERVLAIDPRIAVTAHACFYLPETANAFDFSLFDYIVDAIDTVKGKLEIVTRAKALGVPVISSMGAGNKLDPARLRVSDIYQTRVDPLARVMRTELRRRGVPSLKVVYSDEPPLRPLEDEDADCQRECASPPDIARPDGARRAVPGSNAFVPAAAGLLIASEVVRELAGMLPPATRANP